MDEEEGGDEDPDAPPAPDAPLRLTSASSTSASHRWPQPPPTSAACFQVQLTLGSFGKRALSVMENLALIWNWIMYRTTLNFPYGLELVCQSCNTQHAKSCTHMFYLSFIQEELLLAALIVQNLQHLTSQLKPKTKMCKPRLHQDSAK
ncbi:uncharacterized protein LOC125631227 [Caretta caretta]|uniref:uncharacterized protein LOC125631227 n=1 Tax=Caretta caretta TaxID=8467 RepID=UPI003F4B7453